MPTNTKQQKRKEKGTEKASPKRQKKRKKMSYREDFHNVVGGGSRWIDGRLAEDSHEVDPIRLQNPLLDCFILPLLVNDNLLLRVLLRVVHVDLCERGSHDRHVRVM